LANTWEYDGTRYSCRDEEYVPGLVTAHVKEEFDAAYRQALVRHQRASRRGKTRARPRCAKFTKTILGNVLQVMKSLTYLDGAVIDPPCLLPEGRKKNLLAVRNGLLDLDALLSGRPGAEVLLPHSADWFAPVCLPYAFDPDAACPTWEMALARALGDDASLVAVVQEYAGYLLTRSTDEQVAMILFGPAGAGKSVCCAGLEALVGAQNTAHVPLDLFGGRFALWPLLGKMLNVYADVGKLDRRAEGLLKGYINGDPITVDRKGLFPVEVVPTARLLFSCNELPQFDDRSDGVWRLLLLVPFTGPVPQADRVKGMDKVAWWEKSGELPGMLLWAVRGLARLRAQNGFTPSPACADAVGELRLASDPTLRFFKEHLEACAGARPLPKEVVYLRCLSWCSLNGIRDGQKLQGPDFGKDLLRVFPGVKGDQKIVVNGKRYNGYTGLAFTSSDAV
jgi:P4 family phage/plasmid primase-like protien